VKIIYAKKIKRPVVGEEAIKKRLEDCGMEALDYDKVMFEHGSAEFVSLKDKINLVGVNGSCISDEGFYLRNNNEIASLQYWWPPQQVKGSICMLYNTTKPYFKDVNKQRIQHHHPRLGRAIIRMKKKMGPQIIKGTKPGWLIMEYTDDDLTSISEDASEYGFTSRIYLFLMRAKEMTEQLNELYGPITLRQLYYKLVSAVIIENNHRSYHNFIDHMTNARERGVIESHLFEDRSRREIFHYGLSYKNNPANKHIKENIMQSLEFPEIDIWDNQPYYVELWIEKDALISLFDKVAAKKQVHLFPSRGYTSHTKIYEAQQRFARQKELGKQCVSVEIRPLRPTVESQSGCGRIAARLH
jgi:hypothetical protein